MVKVYSYPHTLSDLIGEFTPKNKLEQKGKKKKGYAKDFILAEEHETTLVKRLY